MIYEILNLINNIFYGQLKWCFKDQWLFVKFPALLTWLTIGATHKRGLFLGHVIVIPVCLIGARFIGRAQRPGREVAVGKSVTCHLGTNTIIFCDTTVWFFPCGKRCRRYSWEADPMEHTGWPLNLFPRPLLCPPVKWVPSTQAHHLKFDFV